MSLSIGIAETDPDEFADEDQLIKVADEKMYLTKKESRLLSPQMTNLRSSATFENFKFIYPEASNVLHRMS